MKRQETERVILMKWELFDDFNEVLTEIQVKSVTHSNKAYVMITQTLEIGP